MTLRSLARELKVDPMAIYHYFPDRKTLLAAALAQAYSELPAEFTRTRDAAADTLECLEAYRRISGKQTVFRVRSTLSVMPSSRAIAGTSYSCHAHIISAAR